MPKENNDIAITARSMAYMRSLDVSVSQDLLAKHFVTDESKNLGDIWLSAYPGLARHGALRCRYMEDTIDKYINKGATQVINIAAGLNTFPYRHKSVSKLSHYAEFDLPNMVNYKKEAITHLIKQGVIQKPSLDIQYIAADLTKDLNPSLTKLSWDWTQKTIVIMEGISYYIPKNHLQHAIQTLAKYLAKGSAIFFDYFRPEDTETKLYKSFFDTVTPKGELIHTFFTKDSVVELFKPFQIVSDQLITEIEKQYCHDQKTIEFASYLIAQR